MYAFPTYRARWQSRWLETDKPTWITISHRDLFENWEELKQLVEEKVRHENYFANQCLYAGERELGEVFLNRAVLAADRIIAEDKCRHNHLTQAEYPRNFAIVLRERAYARWLLGEKLGRAALRQAAGYLYESVMSGPHIAKLSRDAYGQNFYMEAVRAALLAVDADTVASWLRIRTKFQWHFAEERALLTRLVEQRLQPDAVLRRDFEAYFDRVRDPDYLKVHHTDRFGQAIFRHLYFIRTETLTFETGLLRQLYFVQGSPHDNPDPKAVIEAIAR